MPNAGFGFESDEGDEGDEGFESDEGAELDEAVRSSSSVCRECKRAHGRAGHVQGSGVLTAELPDGRRTRMRITPALATARDVNRLAAQARRNDQRQAEAEAVNARAINKLKSTLESAVKKLTARQVKGDARLAKRILDGHAKTVKRLTQELRSSKGTVAKLRKELRQSVKAERWNATRSSLTVSSGMPTFAAYGVKGDPFAPANLKLAASLAGWQLFPDILDQLSPKGSRPAWLNSLVEGWWVIGPIGHVVTSRVLLHKTQTERFVSGVTTVRDLETEIDIPVGEDFQEEFKKRTNVPVMTTIISPGMIYYGEGDVELIQVESARVERGKLLLTISGIPALSSTMTIAWVVDTQSTT